MPLVNLGNFFRLAALNIVTELPSSFPSIFRSFFSHCFAAPKPTL